MIDIWREWGDRESNAVYQASKREHISVRGYSH